MSKRKAKKQQLPHVPIEEMVFTGPGSRLRYARIAKNLSLGEIAKHLRLTELRLTEIENDNYQSTGSSTFAKGYIRAYAKLVGLNDEELLQEYEQLGFATTIPSHKPTLLTTNEVIKTRQFMRSNKAKRSLSLKPVLALIIIVIIAGLIAFFWQYRDHHKVQQFLGNTMPNAVNQTQENQPSQQPLSLPIQNNATGNQQAIPLPLNPPVDTNQPNK